MPNYLSFFFSCRRVNSKYNTPLNIENKFLPEILINKIWFEFVKDYFFVLVNLGDQRCF